MKKVNLHFLLLGLILFLGAICLYFINFYSFIVYLLIIIFLLFPIYLYLKEEKEKFRTYVSKAVSKIKDSYDKGLDDFPIGIIIIDKNRNIEWANSFIYNYFDIEKFLGSNILDLMPSIKSLLNFENEDTNFLIDNRHYRVQYKKDSGYIYFFDVTDVNNMRERMDYTRPAVMMINIDNLEEIYDELDDVHTSNLFAQITTILTDWAKIYDVYLKRIDDDRFLGLLNFKCLQDIESNKFSILDEIRELKEDYDTQITLSIGVGVGTDFLPELGELSKTALELSLGRGGDQVAIKDIDGNIRLYGGKTNPQEKRTRIKARVLSNALSDIVKESDKVIVMGHKKPDFDSIGSCIGILEFSRLNGKECYIVLNENDRDDTINKIMNEIEKDYDYSEFFIDSDKALEIITKQTTLVIVDTSDSDRVIDVYLLAKSTKRVVIDHHRRGENIIDNALLNYIEPYASSASELISELIEYQAKGKKILPLSATIMLGGIVLDSQNFAIRTGSRTFDAAAYLRSNGADPIKIKTILKEPIENFINRSEIIMNAFNISENIIIAQAPKDKIYNNVMLAQSADLLINMKDIEASFVIGYLSNDRVGISARSLGNKNVQIVMEKLGGGGHLSNAATQIDNADIEEVIKLLITVIKEQLLEN